MQITQNQSIFKFFKTVAKENKATFFKTSNTEINPMTYSKMGFKINALFSVVIFIFEIITLLILQKMTFEFPHFFKIILNPLLLLLFSLPVLYFLLFRPLKKQLMEHGILLNSLHISEDKFEKTLLTMPNPLSISELEDGQIFTINKAFTKLFGFSNKEAIGKTTHYLFPNLTSKKRREIIAKTRKSGAIKDFEIDLNTNNNKVLNCLMSCTIINIKNVSYIVTIYQDITKRKFEIKELKFSKQKAEQSDQLKTEFLNNMSHEIRTPINAIMGFSNFLSDPDLTIDKRKKFINIIQNSSKQLMHIIDDILEISELETKQIRVCKDKVCLNDVLFELFTIFNVNAKEHNIPLYIKKGLSDEESTITTDESKLLKIVSNILENALKFTNEGFIEFGYYVKTINNLPQLIIYVKDTGIGIAKNKQEIIFDRFSQANKGISSKVGGLGLGLSIAKENTLLIDGKISIKSEIGKGTTFFITIPYSPVYTNSKVDEISSKQTILIVDDEELNFILLETLLSKILKIKCQILHVKNGSEAVEICKINPTIYLVLMDLKMPVMDGFEATRLLKGLFPRLPIIAQTAYSTKSDKEKAFSAGCDDFISKPIKIDLLKSIINKYPISTHEENE